MKNPWIVFAGLLVFTVILTGSLWRELRTERQKAATLGTKIPEAIPASCAPLSAAGPSAAAAPVVAADAVAKLPACAADPSLTDAEVMQVRMAALTVGISAQSLAGSSEDDLMKNPEYRQARLTMQRIRVAHSYPGLAEELRLSEHEANQLFELIANSAPSMSEGNVLGAGSVPAAEQMERLQRQAAQLRDGADGIRARLGEARYTQFQEYLKTRSARNQAVTYGSTLAAAGQPLNDTQFRALTGVMIAEQQRETQTVATSIQNRDPGSPVPRASQTLEAFHSRQEESGRRTIEAAAPLLSAAQIRLLQEQVEQQAATRRRTLDFARGRETPQPR